MGHTAEQIINAANRHSTLSRFLDAAHSGTADMIVGAKAMGKGREQQVSVPQGVMQPVVEWAISEAKKIEVEFGVTPWNPPKAVHGPAEKKKG